MTRLVWGSKNPLYDLGIDQGVLYLDGTGVAWNGLVAFQERDTSEVDVEYYFDGSRIFISQQHGNFEGLLSAFTYPDAFAEYNGYSDRKEYRRFGFAYRTQRGVDNYQMHLVYNVLVKSDARSWSTVSDKIDPSLFNWNVYGEPVGVPGSRGSAHVVLETNQYIDVAAELEDILYGTDTTEPRMPSPEELIALYEAKAILKITYNGNGTYTATGSDAVVQKLTNGRFRIDAPSAYFATDETFVVNSY